MIVCIEICDGTPLKKKKILGHPFSRLTTRNKIPTLCILICKQGGEKCGHEIENCWENGIVDLSNSVSFLKKIFQIYWAISLQW